MMKNIELFQRALERKQNSQFELVNQNLISHQEATSGMLDKVVKIQNMLLKTVNSMSDGFNSII